MLRPRTEPNLDIFARKLPNNYTAFLADTSIKEDIEAQRTLHVQGIHRDQSLNGRRRLAVSANHGWRIGRIVDIIGS